MGSRRLHQTAIEYRARQAHNVAEWRRRNMLDFPSSTASTTVPTSSRAGTDSAFAFFRATAKSTDKHLLGLENPAPGHD